MKRFLLSVVLTALIIPSSIAQFKAGNLVVLRVGDGSAALSNASTAIFLDEYTTAGTVVKSWPMPASGTSVITNSGSATSEGALSRSGDGRYLTFAGYGRIPGTGSIASTGVDSVKRVIARVDAAGNVDVTTRLGDAYDANNIRGATTLDGKAFWTSGTASGTFGGVHYALLGATTSTQISTTVTNIRVVGVFNNQLYAGSASGTFMGISTVGTGLPTTSGQTITILNGFPTSTGPSPYGFAVNPAGNIIYVANDSSSTTGRGVQKWTLSGTTWTLAYTLNSGIPAGVRGVTIDWSGANPVIYATDAQSGLNRLVKVVDAGASSAFTVLATAATNTVLRGVAFAPTANATSVEVSEVSIPQKYALYQNYPNPFNPSTTLRYSIVEPGTVSLKIFNVLGEEVATLVDGQSGIGTFSVVWDASQQASGVYFARLTSVSDSKHMIVETRRMMLVK
jgi:hypothetical protein